MLLREVLFNCPDLYLKNIAKKLSTGPFSEVSISTVCSDSRLVKKEGCFVAVKGALFDGHRLISEVIKKKVSVIFFESKSEENFSQEEGVLLIPVVNTRKVFSNLLYVLNKNKLSGIKPIGITGTNGKTSISYLLEFLLSEQGEVPGVMGTIDHHIKNKIWKTHLTSPDTASLFSRLSDFNQEGITTLILEVSSHGLSQSRLEVFPFEYVVFTNLTQDHLDYHKTFSEYFKAKQKLFLEDRELMNIACEAFINIDDEYGKKLKLAPQLKLFSYGQDIAADFCFKVLEQNVTGLKVALIFNKKNYIMQLPLVGLHNVYNAVASLAVATKFGYSLESLIRSLSKFKGVPGRLQKVENDWGKSVFIDYAHTPDAILSVLGSVKPLAKKVGIVFGCGGGRDKLKRPLMLEAALKMADFVVLTSDNPRGESPKQIIVDALDNKKPSDYDQKLFVIINRSEAIKFALKQQKEGDVLIVAGKGHEKEQIIGDKVIPWDDYTETQRFLSDEHTG